MELTGITRKKMAEILSNVLENQLQYDGKDIYKVNDNLDRTWVVCMSDKIQCQKQFNDRVIGANTLYSVKLSSPFLNMNDFHILEDILLKLKGVNALTNTTTDLEILIEANNCEERYVKNIENVMKSKGMLIYKAVDSYNKKPIEVFESGNTKTVSFPMFNSTVDVLKLKAYLQLSQAIHNYCYLHKRVSPKINESSNEKYTFRTWLLRLKMIGDEYKTTRNELVKNLVGNTAWRNYELSNQTQLETQNQQFINTDLLDEVKF